MPDPAGTVRLTQASPLLRERFGTVTNYSQLWRLAIDGLIPTQRRGRITLIREADLPVVRDVLAALEPKNRLRRTGLRAAMLVAGRPVETADAP